MKINEIFNEALTLISLYYYILRGKILNGKSKSQK